MGIAETYQLDDTVLYKNNPQINNECTNIYLGQVLCVTTKSYPYILATNVTQTEQDNEPVTSTILPTNVPTSGPAVQEITSTAEVWATVTESAAPAQETSSISGVSVSGPGWLYEWSHG